MHDEADTNGVNVASDGLDNVIFRRVIERHSVKLAGLAARANRDESYICRIHNSQYPVPAPVFRVLWEMTHDPEILEYIAPADEVLHVPVLVGGETDPMVAMGALLGDFTSGIPSERHEIKVDTAINALILYRKRIRQGDAPITTQPLKGELSA